MLRKANSWARNSKVHATAKPKAPDRPEDLFSNDLEAQALVMKDVVRFPSCKCAQGPNCPSQLRSQLPDLFAVTYDGWKSAKTQGIVSLTAHYIHDFRICRILIGTARLPSEHNTQGYASTIRDILQSIGATPSNIFGSTSDNAFLNDALARELGIPRFRCQAHRLSLILTHLIWPKDPTDLSKLIVKCRELVHAAKNIYQANDALEEAQELLEKVCRPIQRHLR